MGAFIGWGKRLQKLIFLSIGLMGAHGSVWSGQYILMTSIDFPLNKVNQSELKKIYSGTLSVIDRVPIKLALRKEADKTEQFMKNYLGQSRYDYLDSINLAYYQQRIRSLPQIMTINQFLNTNGKNPGLVIYVEESELNEVKLPRSIKLISITSN